MRETKHRQKRALIYTCLSFFLSFFYIHNYLIFRNLFYTEQNSILSFLKKGQIYAYEFADLLSL